MSMLLYVETSCSGICRLFAGDNQSVHWCPFCIDDVWSHDYIVHCSLLHRLAALHLDHIRPISALVQRLVHPRADGLWDCWFSS